MKGIRMKRMSLVAALLGAIILAFAGIASAVDTPPAGTSWTTPGSSATPNANSNGAAVTHYTASYNDPLMGQPVNCVGVHLEKKGKPSQDSFTCTSTGGVLGNEMPGQALVAPWGWYSDYNGVFTTNITGTISADGMSYSAVATY
jgi:hypothetical protein